MKQLLIAAGLSFTLFTYVAKAQPTPPDGKKIYKQSCTFCHGMDGNLGVNGSVDLTKSKLNAKERVAIIKNGRGMMTGFGSLLTDAEIKAVANYTLTL